MATLTLLNQILVSGSAVAQWLLQIVDWYVKNQIKQKQNIGIPATDRKVITSMQFATRKSINFISLMDLS